MLDKGTGCMSWGSFWCMPLVIGTPLAYGRKAKGLMAARGVIHGWLGTHECANLLVFGLRQICSTCTHVGTPLQLLGTSSLASEWWKHWCPECFHIHSWFGCLGHRLGLSKHAWLPHVQNTGLATPTKSHAQQPKLAHV